MRWIVVTLLALLGSGCVANRRAVATETPGGEGNAGSRANMAASPSPAKDRPRPAVVPDDAVSGRVVLVNQVLRFVVMDFPVRRMPGTDQRLNVYHNGQKTGEVKVTGPTRDTTTAGDIMAGGAQVGDEVRDD